MADDNAFIVGIDRYSVHPLTSCVNDAKAIAPLLARDGTAQAPPNYDVYPVLGDQDNVIELTREGLKDRLAIQIAGSRGKRFVFYFSGHGRLTEYGPELVAQDGGGISLDDVVSVLDRSKVAEAVVILDCCFSGGVANEAGNVGEGPWTDFERARVRENVVFLAATGPKSVALGGPELSRFTGLLVEGLDGAAADIAGRVDPAGLYAFAAGPFRGAEQRPMFKGHYEALSPLRKVDPEVSLTLLRRMSTHFPLGTDEVTLAPEDVFDQAQAPADARQRCYRDLRGYRRHGLVDCSDDRDIASHAAEGGVVCLTARGRYVRHMAVAGRI